MTHKVTVRFGGAVDSEVHDYSDRVRLLGDGTPLIHGGMSCDNGSASMGELILDDEQNDIPHRTDPPGLQLAAHNQLIWSEDSPGYESWLSIGRIDNKNVGRPYERTADVNRQWTVQWADANIDLDGLTLTEDKPRPAETDVDRVLWVLATFCNGSPRLTTVIENHLVASSPAYTMPAKTYEAGTELVEIFDDCASFAGKVYSVVIHDQDSASHTCFLYIDEEDHTTYLCTLSISDQVSEVDGETVFEPHWRQGGATLEQGQELISGLVSRYGMDTTATAVVLSDVTQNAYDYWVKPYNDDLAVTAAEATTRAGAMVRSRWNEHLTHQPSILIPARLHYLIKAGMSIEVRSAAMMGGQYLGTVQTRRIANIEWAHAGWTDEPLLWANLQLDRTPRKLPLSIGTKPGPKPPTAGSAPSIADSGGTYNYSNGGFLLKDGLSVAGADDDMLIVFVVARDGQPTTGVRWIPDTADVGTFDAFTLIDTATVGSPALEVTAWKLRGPSPSVASRIQVTQGGGNRATSGAWYYLKGVSSNTVLEAEDTNAGAGVSATVAGVSGGYLLLDGVGWQATHTAALTATAGANQTQDYQNGQAGAFGDPDAVLATSHQDGANGGVMSWSTIPSSGNYSGAAHIAIALVGTAADAPPPAADDSSGDIGTTTDGCYATCDHKHPAQTAAVTPITDAGGYYTGTDVEAALQEVGPLVAGSGTTYVTAADGGKETVNTVAASGTTETLDLADGNVHDVTLTDNCTFTFTGATAGKGCSFTLVLRQDGSGSRTATWPAPVAWVGGSAPTLQTAANAVDLIAFLTLDGGTSWFGIHSGTSGGSVGSFDDLSDVTITSPAVGDMLRYDGSAWVNTPGRWEPATTNPGTGPELVWSGDEIVMTWSAT